jgi:hypothetical protein
MLEKFLYIASIILVTSDVTSVFISRYNKPQEHALYVLSQICKIQLLHSQHLVTRLAYNKNRQEKCYYKGMNDNSYYPTDWHKHEASALSKLSNDSRFYKC